MNALQLYDAMKRAYKMFGLRFFDMDEVSVAIRGDYIVLSHGGIEYPIHVPVSE